MATHSTEINLSFTKYFYYVMNRCNDTWIQISDLYPSLDEAQDAYDRLRKQFPFARLGGRAHQD